MDISKLEKEFKVILNITTLTELEKGVLADKFAGSLQLVKDESYHRGYLEGKLPAGQPLANQPTLFKSSSWPTLFF